jgi:hypothetical protein
MRFSVLITNPIIHINQTKNEKFFASSLVNKFNFSVTPKSTRARKLLFGLLTSYAQEGCLCGVNEKIFSPVWQIILFCRKYWPKEAS